jgi:hypothetical protein
MTSIPAQLARPAWKVSFDRPGTDWPANKYEFPLVRFLEREGYDVSYTTDYDISEFPQELMRHRLVIVNGHSEYWSPAMRSVFDQARDAGTNLAFTGANDAYWQVRYEDGGRTIVGYKESAALDPIGDPALLTTRFRDLPEPRPECRLLGVRYQVGSWGIAGPNSQDLSVNPRALTDTWFANTGFDSTSVLRGIMGGEWDGVERGRAPGALRPSFTGTGRLQRSRMLI